MNGENINAYLFGHFSDEVSRPTLQEILAIVRPDQRVVLCGFSDYTKHVINNFSSTVVGVVDFDDRFVGFNFREQTVVHASSIDSFVGKVDAFVVCSYDQLVQFYDLIDGSALRGTPVLWPENFDDQKAHKYDVFRQSPRYTYQNSKDRLGEPPTMMPRETITFMTELLQASLRVPGDVAEIGVWQGGSGWNMAKLMQWNKDERPLHLFDFFDLHERSNPEAIMCLDEIRARFKFYEPVAFYRGMAGDNMPALESRQFCFVHIDLGFQADVVEFFFDRMPEGAIMLLDNYGHVRSSPGLFDAFFADRGYSVIRSPFSYQAFVAK